MMKYILLVYRDVKRWEALSDVERAAFEEACQAQERDLANSLHLIDAKGLNKDSAVTVRIVDDEKSVLDSPEAEEQEQLFQILFIQARDLNAAIQIASQLPQARAGAIEVRPVIERLSFP